MAMSEARKRYMQSEKGKAARKRYMEKRALQKKQAKEAEATVEKKEETQPEA